MRISEKRIERFAQGEVKATAVRNFPGKVTIRANPRSEHAAFPGIEVQGDALSRMTPEEARELGAELISMAGWMEREEEQAREEAEFGQGRSDGKEQ